MADIRKFQRRVSPRKGAVLGATGLLIGAAIGLGLTQMTSSNGAAQPLPTPDIACSSPKIVDGDTLRCGSTRIRLYGIDAPEMPGHCRPGRACTPGDPYASTDNLRVLIGGGTIACQQQDTDRYGRAVARCTASGRDLSCAQVEGGFAVRRYGLLIC
jgi:endonuclease YncB( thermonuclease family)